MVEWQVGDIAVAVRTATCGCGGHGIEERSVYRVGKVAVHPLTDRVFLSVDGQGHFFPHEFFRREQKTKIEDLFKLASPRKVPEHV